MLLSWNFSYGAPGPTQRWKGVSRFAAQGLVEIQSAESLESHLGCILPWHENPCTFVSFLHECVWCVCWFPFVVLSLSAPLQSFWIYFEWNVNYGQRLMPYTRQTRFKMVLQIPKDLHASFRGRWKWRWISSMDGRSFGAGIGIWWSDWVF